MLWLLTPACALDSPPNLRPSQARGTAVQPDQRLAPLPGSGARRAGTLHSLAVPPPVHSGDGASHFAGRSASPRGADSGAEDAGLVGLDCGLGGPREKRSSPRRLIGRLHLFQPAWLMRWWYSWLLPRNSAARWSRGAQPVSPLQHNSRAVLLSYQALSASRWAFGPILSTGRAGARWHLTEKGPDAPILSNAYITIRLARKLHTLAIVRGEFFWKITALLQSFSRGSPRHAGQGRFPRPLLLIIDPLTWFLFMSLLTHRLVLLCVDAYCLIFWDLPVDVLAAPESALCG